MVEFVSESELKEKEININERKKGKELRRIRLFRSFQFRSVSVFSFRKLKFRELEHAQVHTFLKGAKFCSLPILLKNHLKKVKEKWEN